MTNITAVLLLTLSTNWTSIGTFTPTDGLKSFDVQEGRLQTNVIAEIALSEIDPLPTQHMKDLDIGGARLSHQMFHFPIKTNLGLVVAERKVEKPFGKWWQPEPMVIYPKPDWTIPMPHAMMTNDGLWHGGYGPTNIYFFPSNEIRIQPTPLQRIRSSPDWTTCDAISKAIDSETNAAVRAALGMSLLTEMNSAIKKFNNKSP